MSDANKEVFRLAGGEVYLSEEQEAIHIKAVSGRSDPVELTVNEAKKLAQYLLEIADRIGD